MIGLKCCLTHYLTQPGSDLRHIPIEVGIVAAELKIGYHASQRLLEAVGAGIVHAIRWRAVCRLNVFGGYRRAHENEIVVEVGAMQDLAAD